MAKDRPDESGPPDVADARPRCSDLIDYIVETHHALAWKEMPRISELVERALRIHGGGEANPLPAIATLWRKFALEFEAHMRQEEEILFPAVRAAESARRAWSRRGRLDAPLHCAENMHEEQWSVLAEMRRLAGGYLPPTDAGETWRALYFAMDAFEKDVQEHVRIENEALFPRVLALDLRAAGRRRRPAGGSRGGGRGGRAAGS